MKLLFLFLVFSVDVLGESPGFSKTGTDDFKALARSGKIVDKTLLIKDLIDQNDLVTLITRPRRWGKSTSMSMLWRFFALEHDQNEAKQNRELFKTLKIRNATTQDPVTGRQVNIFEQFQGKCPSIFLSFKDVRPETLSELILQVRAVISAEYRRHKYLAEELENRTHDHKSTAYNRKLAQSALSKFERLSVDEGDAASKEDLKKSLLFLSQLLYEYNNKTKVCIFFDEYDAPLHMAFKKDYLEEATEFMRGLFGSVLKGNDIILERGLLTGILRLAKADLLSGINNLVEDNVFNSHYASHYGFTDKELDELFDIFHVERTDEDVFRKSYNGYSFYQGQNASTKVSIYNPWSVIQYLKNNGKQDNYWLNTGGTELLDPLVILPDVQDALATLRFDNPIHIRIPKDVTFSGLKGHPATLWPLLVHTGYLTLANPPVLHLASEEYEVDLRIPNTEVRAAYAKFHSQWLKSNNLPDVSSIEQFSSLIASVVAKDSEKVSIWIKREKASGSPIDFTNSKWIVNPLQLAALSGNSEIFTAVYEQYPALRNSVDSDGLNIGDYLHLTGLRIASSPEPSFFKEAVPWLEPLCFGAAYTQPALSTLIVGGGGYLFLHKIRHWAAKGSSLVVLGGVLITLYKDISTWFLKKGFGVSCDRYNHLQKIPPKDFSSLLMFAEYVARNSNSYVSLAACRDEDVVISRFEKAATDVRHAEIKPLTFFLCQSQSHREL